MIFEDARMTNKEGPANKVESVDNHIYFYADVDTETVFLLHKEIRTVNLRLGEFALKYSCAPPNIFLHINSAGGNVQQGFAAADLVRSSKIPIITIVEGRAASAATLMSIVGKKRKITPNSLMLVHELSSMIFGRYSQLKDEANNLDQYMDMVRDFYKKYTKLQEQQLDELLKHDIWWSANKCLEYGLVDEIIS